MYYLPQNSQLCENLSFCLFIYVRLCRTKILNGVVLLIISVVLAGGTEPYCSTT